MDYSKHVDFQFSTGSDYIAASAGFLLAICPECSVNPILGLSRGFDRNCTRIIQIGISMGHSGPMGFPRARASPFESHMGPTWASLLLAHGEVKRTMPTDIQTHMGIWTTSSPQQSHMGPRWDLDGPVWDRRQISMGYYGHGPAHSNPTWSPRGIWMGQNGLLHSHSNPRGIHVGFGWATVGHHGLAHIDPTWAPHGLAIWVDYWCPSVTHKTLIREQQQQNLRIPPLHINE